MREILFIADDLGLSEEVNRAVLHAHRHGVLDGAALMMGQPGTAQAVDLARRNPALQVGWHLHLTDSRPCTRDAWPWGTSPARAGMALGLLPGARDLAREEIRAQWRAFRETGLECRFVNAHHHLHFHPFVRRELVRVLPEDLPGWVRWGRVRFFPDRRAHLGYRLLDRILLAPHRGRFPWPESTTLWGVDRTFAMDAGEVARLLPRLGEGRHELLFHPRRIDPERPEPCDPDTRCLLDPELAAEVEAQRAAPRPG